MKRKGSSGDPPSITSAIGDDSQEGDLKHIGGSEFDQWNNMLANQAIKTVPSGNLADGSLTEEQSATIYALIGIAPKDELEGMMAAQLVAAHNAVMECYRRAVLCDRSPEWQREHLNQASRLSRTWATLLEALNRHRGKGQQKVTVEHVHIHAGGQAVVGTVEASHNKAGGGDRRKTEEQCDAKQIAHAPEPEVRSALEADRQAVPERSDEER